MRMSKIISSSMILFVCLMVFDATFNNISVISCWLFLLVNETGIPGEKYTSLGAGIELTT
jgi:hypothetical protein